MKKVWERTKEIIGNGEYTAREAVLAAVCLFFLGMLLGIFFSPRKNTMIASNNGNNNRGTILDSEEEEGAAEDA